MKKTVFLFLVVMLPALMFAQSSRKKSTRPEQQSIQVPIEFYKSLNFRCIGPFRGGRSAAVTGIPGHPLEFYFGSTGGGVWKTKDGGQTWDNVSDGYFGGSIGAVAVSNSDKNIIYVGGGEMTVRGNVSYGYGVFKSEDAGKSWSDLGLKDSRHIGRIRIHPAKPNTVYVAVMGDLYQSSESRGVYKTVDGGESWERVLFANSDAGAVDLIMDPSNPKILYASTWRIRRTPYDLSSGGEGSALWKSTDEGLTWVKISDNQGFAKGTLGIIGITVSPANPDRLYAIVEAEKGGVYRSDNAGDTWRLVNDDRNLRQRAWYYSRIYADPADDNTLYVLNVRYHKSTDGGQSFKSANAPHGDHHDLWIDPIEPQRMIIGDDGGAQVTFDGGENWSSPMNQPTAQFYRVVTDNHFPFRIYGAQQDNSTVRISHRSAGYSIDENDWETTAGGESAHIAVDPKDNDIVYGGSYGGYLQRIDHKTQTSRIINVWPDNPMGHGAEGMKYRFQWNFPIFFSPNDPNKLYAASNHLHVSTDEGQSWTIISPDLTRNDTSKLGPSGGPITKDNTGVEYYCTIFAACESSLEEGVIWTGSDDGLIYLSRDQGANWTNVTPNEMPEWMMINSIDVDPFVKGGANVAGTLYKSGDYRPFLYQTKDYGQTWKLIVNGIPQDQFTRVVRADPKKKGLLYAGTEEGLFISFDDGATWINFQLNLPVVPITDITIKSDHLILATQGRSFWILDDLAYLRQIQPSQSLKDFNLFVPGDAFRFGPVVGDRVSKTSGQNHPGGAQIFFYLPEVVDSIPVNLVFRDDQGNVISDFYSKPEKDQKKLEIKAGLNKFTWDMQYADAEGFDGLIMWSGSLRGPKAIPGVYTVQLEYGEQSMQQAFEIKPDPRSSATEKDMKDQLEFLIMIRDELSLMHQTIVEIRKVRKEVDYWVERAQKASDGEPIINTGKQILDKMSAVENELYQTKNKSGQDPLNFPIKLNDKLAGVASVSSVGDYAPTSQARVVAKELMAQINLEISKWNSLKNRDLPSLNKLIKESGISAINLINQKL